MLRKVLEVASRPGDVILDCFLGSGTTAAVAHKCRRRWIGVEWSKETLTTFALPRLSKVVAGEDDTVVTRALGWRGGGGFRVLDVQPSMFQVDGGRVVLAPWATGGALADSVCAQGSWEREDSPPFSGRKGRVRLAVIDGLVTADVALLLAGWLADDERLTIYATAVDPGAGTVLGNAYRGSTVRRIPQSLLAEYRREWRDSGSEWISLVGTGTAETGDSMPAGLEAVGQ